MTIVGALAGGGPPASVRDRKLYVLVDIFNNGLLNGIRILFFLCCKFCLSVTDLLGRSSQVLPDVTEKRSKFFWSSAVLLRSKICDGTVLGDGSNKGVVTAHLEEFDRTG